MLQSSQKSLVHTLLTSFLTLELTYFFLINVQTIKKKSNNRGIISKYICKIETLKSKAEDLMFSV